MKKILSLMLVLTMFSSLTACAGSGGQAETSSRAAETAAESGAESSGAAAESAEETPETAAAEPPAEADEAAAAEVGTEAPESGTDSAQSGNILVAYFSWADNAILDENVDAMSSPSVLSPGNVEQLAGWVQEETGGDLFSIRVTDPYPSDWDACLERANEERGNGARPELVENVADMEAYDTIFLGYPNWWYGVPMALLTFLEQNDFSGKQIYLFCSHGTGGLANSVEIITEAVPDAVISDSIFDCYEEDAPSSEEAVKVWAAGLGIAGADSAGGAENTAEEAGAGSAVSEQPAAQAEAAAADRLAVRCGDIEVIYELNDSPAAASLAAQLPLTLEVEDYSTNEKIFYPPQELDTSDTPAAEGGAGTLAYYAPWGDVVMFYGDYSANSSLYELGEAVSGADQISRMSGSIEVAPLEE